MKTFVIVTIAFLSVAARAQEPVTLPRTEARRITAKSNGVEYKLYVALPQDYAASKAAYPVIYLLDADYSFAIARNVVEHLAERRHLRWAIVVGIAYAGEPRYREHRTRDYTPTHTLSVPPGAEHQRPYQKHSGGGAKFRDFLRGELLPYIDRTYRTTAERVLAGHSYGALFATWMLLTAPDLFTGYVVVSPSLWYDERLAFAVEKTSVPFAGTPRRVHVSVGAMENAMMDSDAAEMSRRLRARHRNVETRYELMAGETHNSVFPAAFSRGIRWVLKGR